MTNEIISYLQMCQQEGVNLQRGMNFRLGREYSVILMSIRPNAPYRDQVEDEGSTLIYEGHDIPRYQGTPDPKSVDQPKYNPSGSMTENGKFYQAAQDFKLGLRHPEMVRVYEKLRPGIWSDNGFFQLVDSWQEHDGKRMVFKFKLIAVVETFSKTSNLIVEVERRRVIPTSVKREVWKRDNGKCVICGSEDELHFDHIIPFSKGGTSLKAENVQILCARHNIEKKDKIE
jgi:hypothetical protein